MMKLFTITIALVLLATTTSNSSTINVPADQPTIQAGIDAAAIGVIESGSGFFVPRTGVTFSTYFGGSNEDFAIDIIRHSNGDFYVVGSTSSTDFPILGGIDSTIGSWRDLWVARFTENGVLVSSTYLGGSSIEGELGISLSEHPSGDIVVCGSTNSLDFPILNAFQENNAGVSDLFVARLSPNLDSLVSGTYIGGSNAEELLDCVVGNDSSLYLLGTTTSDNFPLVNPISSTRSGSTDFVILKLNMDLNQLIFSTYWGGALDEGFWPGSSILTDRDNNILITGNTHSSDFPTLNALDASYNGGPMGGLSGDAVVVKLKGDGSEVIFSTFFGGSGGDAGTSVAIQKDGKLVLVGISTSPDLPLVEPFQGFNGDSNNGTVFIALLDSSGQSVIRSTYFGGLGDDNPTEMILDSDDNIFVCGESNSFSFPLLNAIDTTFDGAKGAFVLKFQSDLKTLSFSTRYGGTGSDGFRGMVVDSVGEVFAVGYTYASDFPVVNEIDPTLGGNRDAILVKFYIESPSIMNLSLENELDLQHVVSHSPNIIWQYFDPTLKNPQIQAEVAVGVDSNWQFAEMWNPSPFNLGDSSIQYAGVPLQDGATYFARLRAYYGASNTAWEQVSFRMNSLPSIPALAFPADSAILGSLSPVLFARNSSDAEADTITYIFELYEDYNLNTLIESDSSVVEQVDSTGWSPSAPLAENSAGYWRVKAFDGFEYSDWSETRLFWVNAANSAPTSFVLDAPADSNRVYDMLPTFRWQSSGDNDPGDSALYKLSVAIDSAFAFVATVDSLSDTFFLWADSLDFGDEYWWKVEAFDANGAVTASSVSFFPTWVLGDANSDGSANIADVTFLINRIFSGGPGPNPPKAGDVNGDCSVNIADVTFLIARIFTGGPPPTIGCAS